MQYRDLGTYGVGVSFASDGLRELKTNSGESIFPRCERNSGRHGATPTLEGVFAVVDIVRARCCNLLRAMEAILMVACLMGFNWLLYEETFVRCNCASYVCMAVVT